uniref:Uncharacterized protein n=1 Tax=Nelumbo nucifera TaxID=4432 RepID=A0A822YNB7_NELNU|nr:TPA_asm: hypothetical protein HUJ06_012434 [Nelumbo nucifera]
MVVVRLIASMVVVSSWINTGSIKKSPKACQDFSRWPSTPFSSQARFHLRSLVTVPSYKTSLLVRERSKRLCSISVGKSTQSQQSTSLAEQFNRHDSSEAWELQAIIGYRHFAELDHREHSQTFGNLSSLQELQLSFNQISSSLQTKTEEEVTI